MSSSWYMNFECILFIASVVTGLITLLDVLWLAPRRKALAIRAQKEVKMPFWADYSRSFFPVLIFVFLFRGFLYEPFRIPTGSLIPTLLVGDFILVDKHAYGYRWPILHTKITQGTPIKRGDIIVFRYPVNPNLDFVKRVVGLPGDVVSYQNKELTINGRVMTQEPLSEKPATNMFGNPYEIIEKREQLFDVSHRIQLYSDRIAQDMDPIVVPAGNYFVVGDNRDDSDDSRSWGFVPDNHILGKAILIWASVDWDNYHFRLNRFGRWIH